MKNDYSFKLLAAVIVAGVLTALFSNSTDAVAHSARAPLPIATSTR